MTLELHYHPFASFCMKVLIALYELDLPFERRVVDLADPAERAALQALWPLAQFPVLRDHAADRTVAESSIVIEYLLVHHRRSDELMPADPSAALDVRMRDRFYDLHVQLPMQRIVVDRLRPAGTHDRLGISQAIAELRTAYAMLERELPHDGARERFTMAECAAAPALHYASRVVPFGPEHPRLAAHLAWLRARPSFARVLGEAAPYEPNFPARSDVELEVLGA